jgi:hypothetical protein
MRDLSTITESEVVAAAKQYLDDTRRIEVRVRAK